MIYDIDHIDRNILMSLQDDASMSNVKLSKHIGLSPAATLDRVKKLENLGIIAKYTAQIDAARLGYVIDAMLFIGMRCASAENMNNFQQMIFKIPLITNCKQLVGDFHFLLSAQAKHMTDLSQKVIEKLYSLDYIETIKTCFVIQNIKDTPLNLTKHD